MSLAVTSTSCQVGAVSTGMSSIVCARSLVNINGCPAGIKFLSADKFDSWIFFL
ncbi:hypothetical protein PISMIDRAFT_681770 [Pisolithus microcarpus 441]|uniref:Uncharacterized protein n=1 Tax=Pisolithus microcarpus 441 TaxID=765257 RepID=A0A0C9Z4I2_9AGAM|nr:hypothetical protein BKA83DRAFT_681770 [Pisolithus microcarpus]KIK11205.1 hypothetical protein PISMIDRAFT_690491 [Pisolithus microcarpus 441]KIK21059.1 hypothetical protein PISMIDRAFT_681770 [Pisolithus microcarpus 441]